MVACCYSRLHISPHLISPDIMTEQKKGGTKEFEQLKHMSTKIQEKISHIVITEKNEKLCQTTGLPGTQGAFSDR